MAKNAVEPLQSVVFVLPWITTLEFFHFVEALVGAPLMAFGASRTHRVRLIKVVTVKTTESDLARWCQPVNPCKGVRVDRWLASGAASQLFWECREEMASEQFGAGIPDRGRPTSRGTRFGPCHL
ncbi:hypothetical protein B0T26DRAFT_800476 [Lasiosphaeria miniovina]|uniref:Uncharacterized protein n=1 Tax=Lasiosphaeria miniovina TaxID=1954250 RepID=A0AA40B7I5_9PEZI|nr:uncharacterized protein B0T26DRAFT_800476 [Lasiosphaeria miniovina]KAK0728813.1 hypothetical protein B0T26DRAFT_800476 [Lasiosphaeria miniovina]